MQQEALGLVLEPGLTRQTEQRAARGRGRRWLQVEEELPGEGPPKWTGGRGLGLGACAVEEDQLG